MTWLPAVPASVLRAMLATALFFAAQSVSSAEGPSIAGAWQSPQGTLRLEHPPVGNAAVMINGTWETPLGRARITRGAYDPAARLMAFAFVQDGSGAMGQAKFSVSPDGSRLTGSFTMAGGAETPWELTRQAAVAPAPAPAPAVRSVAGIWDSSFGVVTLEQDPPSLASTVAVRGFHDESPGHRAEIRDGKFDPATGKLEFTYVQPWRNVTGTGRFTLSANNAQLNGTYNQTGSSGAWKLDRRGGAAAAVAPAPTIAMQTAPPARSVAGTWNSKLGTVTLQHAPVAGGAPVAVAGYHDESRDHRADLRDGKFDPATGTLEFTYVQPWRNVTGKGRFVLSADNNRLTGTYSQPGASGPWELERAGTRAVAPAPAAPRNNAASSGDAGTQLATALIGALLGGSSQTAPAAAPSTSSAPQPQSTPAVAYAEPAPRVEVPAAQPAATPVVAPAAAPVTAPAAVPPSGARAVAVAARSGYTLVLRNDGTVWAFGNNNTGGQVHQGKPKPATEGTPVQIVELVDIVAIAAGEVHALALDRHGAVWAWGENQNGERGNGRAEKGFDNAPPSRVEGLPPIARIYAAGSNSGWCGTSLAFGFDGSVWAWGRRLDPPPEGAQSDRTYVHRWVKPEKKPGLPSDTQAVFAGTFSVLLVQRGGALLRWGQRDTAFYAAPSQPKAVPGLPAVIAVSDRDQTTVALAADGSVWGWGRGSKKLNLAGAQFGVEGEPAQLAGGWKAPDPRAICLGEDHAAVLSGDGTVWTWGLNDHGQLGSGEVDPLAKTNRTTPERVVGLTDVVTLRAGGGHFVALRRDGSVRAWGNGWSGQLGNGKGSNSVGTPIEPLVPAASPAAIDAFSAHLAAYRAKLGNSLD